MDLTYLSLGAGVQSTALYKMADCGALGEKPDVAIFADTQMEPSWVYENLFLLKKGSIPIEIVTAGSLGEAVKESVLGDGHKRFASVPFWVMGKDGRETPGRRQCTREFKIDPIHRRVREILGLKKGDRAKGRYIVEEWLGISFDEIVRAKKSRWDWVKTRWPLIEKRMRRRDCEAFLKGISYPVPKKSSCIFCPYRTDKEYASWQDMYPDEFADAVYWDSLLRKNRINVRATREAQYISRSLVPLSEAVFMYKSIGNSQLSFDGFDDECEGMCGV